MLTTRPESRHPGGSPSIPITCSEKEIGIAEEFVAEFGEVSRIPSFKRLTIIYERQARYEEAIAVCDQALDIGTAEGRKWVRGTERTPPQGLKRLIEPAIKNFPSSSWCGNVTGDTPICKYLPPEVGLAHLLDLRDNRSIRCGIAL